jgi:ribonuclease E
MLINATQEEELRVAIVDGQKLYDLDIEVDSSQQKKANIYKGKITRIEPSLDAAFVEYGADRHGFLPLKDISREYFVKQPESGGRINIREVLKEGQDIVVQIDKDERGNKGAALTTFISLPGRFIVLMPNNPRGGGVSRRIAGEDRDEVKRVQRELEVPEGMSLIVRTAGIGRSIEELNWDLEYLKGVWQSIMQVVLDKPSPFLIYQDSSPVIRALRDHFNSEIGEIFIDDAKTFNEAKEFMEHAMPHNMRKLKAYEDEVPLFTRFQIESQIESAYSHTVSLPSGGSIVIDHTEALVSIDINSARATKGGDIEATALHTNLEAAEEVARQCRLRDLGGLLVIDFIDMGPNKNQRDVENRLRDAVRTDRARVQIGRISRFGLLEMSRQRLRRSLGESAHQVCPRCSGSGAVRSVDSLALAILRLVDEECRKDRTAKVISELPVDVATFLLNEKREWIQRIEERTGVELLLIANPRLETPNYSLRRVRDDQTLLPENTGNSFDLLTQNEDLLEEALKMSSTKTHEKPAVAVVKPATPAPPPQPPREAKPAPSPTSSSGGGLLGFLKRLFVGGEEKPSTAKEQRKSNDSQRRSRTGRSQNNQRNNRNARGRQSERGRKPDNRGNANAGNKKKRGQRNPQKTETQAGAAQDGPAQENSQEQTQGDGAVRKRRRRRRSSNRNREAGSEQNNNAQEQNSGDKGPDNQQAQSSANQQAPQQEARTAEKNTEQPATRPDPAPVSAAPKQPEQKANPNTESKAEPKAESKAESKPAAKPDNDRLLPWETAAPSNTGKTHKVWSSEDNSDQ